MGYCIQNMVIDGTSYPLAQLNDPSTLIAYDGAQSQRIAQYNGFVKPDAIDSLGTDTYHLYPTSGETFKQIENYPDVYYRFYSYKSNFYGIRLCYSDKSEIHILSGATTSEVNNNQALCYFGVYMDAGFAYIYKVIQNVNKTYYDSCGGNNNYGRLLYSLFGGVIATSNGGGATHIAKRTGQLKDLSSNLSDILMVSGGGGGGLLLGDSGWHGTEQNIAWSGNNNKLTVQLDDDDVLFKMYIGSSNIYSFTAPVSDISNIYLQFLIDSENEVAKPSFVYKNGSSYSFNQEEPTDSEMGDIYTWLSAGLPSE